jgi:hypothetical protein
MAISHDETLISDPDSGVFLARRIDRDKFADFTPLADHNIGLFTSKF